MQFQIISNWIVYTSFKILLFSIISFLNIQLVYSQTKSVQGLILDNESKQPISDINISISGTNKGATSDLEGKFKLKLKPGNYRLLFSHIGYEPLEIDIKVPVKKPLRVLLFPSPVQTPGIMVTSSRIPRDSTLTHYVMEARSLVNVPALAEPDPFRAVTLLPSVISANDLKGEIHIQGGGDDENLLILDGVEIQNPYHLLGLVGTFNVDFLQDIQLYTGLMPTKYGDKLSSALVLRTKNMDSVEQAKLRISLLASSVTFHKKIKSLSILGSLRRTYFDLILDLFGKPFGYYFYDGHLQFSKKLNPSWKIEAGGYFNIDRVNPGLNDALESSLLETGEKEDVRDGFNDRWGNQMATLCFTRTCKRTLWQNQVSFNNYFNRFDGKDNDVNIDNTVRDLNWKSNLHWEGKNFFLDTGVFGKKLSYRYGWDEEVGNGTLEEIFYPGVPNHFRWNDRQSILGLHAELQKQLYPFLSLRWGVRGTALKDKMQWLPRLSSRIQFPKSWSWRLAYGENVQWQAYGRDGLEGAVGSPLFTQSRSMRSRILSIALEKKFLFSTLLSLEIYRKKFSRIVRLTDQDFPNFEAGHGLARGADLFILRKKGKFTHQFAYSWLESVYTFGGKTYHPDWDIRHAFKGLLGFHIGKGWSFHTTILAQSGVPITKPGGYVPLQTGDVNLGQPFFWVPLSGDQNNFRSTAYFRSDILLRKEWLRGKRRYEINLQFLNILNNQNIIRSQPRTLSSLSHGEDLNNTTGLPLLPSIGFAMDF